MDACRAWPYFLHLLVQLADQSAIPVAAPLDESAEYIGSTPLRHELAGMKWHDPQPTAGESPTDGC